MFGNTNTGGGVAPPINSFTLQPQPSQLIDLSVLHNHQPNVVSTGLRLAFGEQHLQHPQQQQQQQHQQNQQQQQTGVFSLLSEDITTQIKHQRDEIDQFLRAQVPILLQFKWVRFSFFIVYCAHLQCGNWNCFVSISLGRAVEAHISGEAAETLPCPARRGGGVRRPEAAGEGSRG